MGSGFARCSRGWVNAWCRVVCFACTARSTGHGAFTAPSNEAFDAQLKARDPQMGLRDIEALDSLAGKHHLDRISRHDLPANNMVLVYQRLEDSQQD